MQHIAEIVQEVLDQMSERVESDPIVMEEAEEIAEGQEAELIYA